MGRACFGWFQGGKHWFQLVSASFGWFRVIPLFSNYTEKKINEMSEKDESAGSWIC